MTRYTGGVVGAMNTLGVSRVASVSGSEARCGLNRESIDAHGKLLSTNDGTLHYLA